MDMQIPPSVPAYATGMDSSGFALEELFPAVDPEFKPFGAKVLLQLRRVMNKTKSGIVLPQVTKDAEAWNMQVGKVIALGPLAFKDRKTMQPWPEGVWAALGDFVMVPKYLANRNSVDVKDGMDPVVIVLADDKDIIGLYTGDPRKVKAYVE